VRIPGAIVRGVIPNTTTSNNNMAVTDMTTVVTGTGTATHDLTVFVDLPGLTLGEVRLDTRSAPLYSVVAARRTVVSS
jgi:hypothetical protein